MHMTNCFQSVTWENDHYECRHNQDDLLEFKDAIRMGLKGDLSDFKFGVIVGTSRAEHFRNR